MTPEQFHARIRTVRLILAIILGGAAKLGALLGERMPDQEVKNR